MNRLVQIHNGTNRRVALVKEPHLRLLAGVQSICELAAMADSKGVPMTQVVRESLTEEMVNYDVVYSGKSTWKLLPPIDHPQEPTRCLISGTGLTHRDGMPRRIGMAIGNEFSDHKFEKKNYLNLAGSKLRTCALGPELVIEPHFQSVPGTVKIERGGKTIWSQEILTGETEMCHSLSNIEHHHFKFEGHRRPGDVHVHYFGACSLSFGAGVLLEHGDLMEIAFNNFGRPLQNFLRIADRQDKLITIKSLG
jgi:hypothetical protein